MKFYILLIFFFIFFIYNAKINVSIERKFDLNSLSKPISHYLIINENSTKLYDSYEHGFHLIYLKDNNEIINSKVIDINQKECSKNLINLIKNSGNYEILIFSVENWELCLESELIKTLNLPSNSYDLRLLSNSKAGVGHAFIYFSFGNYSYVKLSHESNFLGQFKINLDEIRFVKDNSLNINNKVIQNKSSFQSLSKNFLKSNVIKRNHEYKISRFMQNNSMNNSLLLSNNSSKEKEFYNMTINAEVKWNFTTDNNVSGSNVIRQNITLSIPKNLSLVSTNNISNCSNLTNTYNKSINISRPSCRNHGDNRKLEIELISYGLQFLETDFSSIKLNDQLIHASKSCGLHLVLLDPCKEANKDKDSEEKKMALQNLSKLYSNVKDLYEKPLKRIDILCYDTFRTANLINFVNDNKDEINTFMNNAERSLLVTCPSLCSFEINYENYNPEKLFTLDQEICNVAVNNRIIDERGGSFLVKVIDTSLFDNENVFSLLSKYNNDITAFKFKLLKHRISHDIWNFSDNETEEIKDSLKKNISSLIEESLEKAEKFEYINETEMNMLEKEYNLAEDILTYIPKFMQTYFPEQKEVINILQVLLKEEKYSHYFKMMESSPIFESFIDPFRNIMINSPNLIDPSIDKRDSFNIEDKILFSKTFSICAENEQNFKSETYHLKHLLENLSPNWKVLIVSMGDWISGVDNSLYQDLMDIGTPELFTEFYKEYLSDNLKNDISLSLIGETDFQSHNDYAEVKRSPSQSQEVTSFEDFINPSKSRLKIDLFEQEPCIDTSETKEKSPQIKIDKNCFSWACKFFFVFQNKINNLHIMSHFNVSSFLKEIASILSNSKTMILAEQLKRNPLSFSQFLLDSPLEFENQTDTKICSIDLDSNIQEGYSKIKYKKTEKKISGDLQNSLLIMIIDNSCQRNFLKSRIFLSSKDDLFYLNRFLQEQDSGSIMALVQYGYFNWTYISSTTLKDVFENYGLLDLSQLSTYTHLSNVNIAYIGKKDTEQPGLLSFSLNSKASMHINLCNYSLFSKCESNILYIRTVGNDFGGNSPLRMRIIILNEEFITKNDYRGISLTLIGCPEKNSGDETDKYYKVWEKNYDLWSDGSQLKDLNDKLKELIAKSYYGTPLFIISSFANYDFYLSENSEDWIEFNLLLEKLGASSLLTYLSQFNSIIINGKISDFGHPFIIVGSPKFEKYSAFEYGFKNNSETSTSQINVQLMIDLNEKQLKCPKPITKFQSLKEINQNFNYKQKADKILSDVELSIKRQMHQIVHYDKGSGYGHNPDNIFKKKNFNYAFKEMQNNDIDLLDLKFNDTTNNTNQTTSIQNDNFNKIIYQNIKVLNNSLTFPYEIDPSSDVGIYNTTQKYLNEKFYNDSKNISLVENSSDEIFPLENKTKQSSCLIIKNSSIPEFHPSKYSNLDENFTYNIYIRGFIHGNSNDSFKNIILNNEILCNSTVEPYGLDHIDLEEFKQNLPLQAKLGRLKLEIYKCVTYKQPAVGLYKIEIITKLMNIIHGIKMKIRKINEFNYELKIFA